MSLASSLSMRKAKSLDGAFERNMGGIEINDIFLEAFNLEDTFDDPAGMILGVLGKKDTRLVPIDGLTRPSAVLFHNPDK